MIYLSIGIVLALAASLYVKRDVFVFKKGKIEYLFITFFALMFAVFLLTGFLAEFVGIFLFLFSLFFFIGTLSK